MMARKKTFFEEFSLAFSETILREKCHKLTRILPSASPNELHSVFVQICGDIFGYGAGGVGFGWDLAMMTRTSSGTTYTGLSQNYRDFASVLSFLGCNGPMFEMIHRLMHDPSHLYEFPVSQLPVNYQSGPMSNRTSGTIGLTAFEYFLYHFANLMVRRQKLNMAPTNVNVNATNETVFVLLLEDYLTCFLPIDPALQAKLFTQPFQPNTPNSPPSLKQPSPSSSNKLNRPSLFKKNFSPRLKEEESNQALMRQTDTMKNQPASSETWRSDTMVKIFVMFWIEGYSGTDGSSNEKSNSPTMMSPQSSYTMDYVSASIKVASTLPSAELMRVVRMFIKHSHYFANSCSQGSVYLPASMRVDIFSSKTNKMLLFSYFSKAVDHWPYDASFRLVLETWLSYIQPWRYLNINATDEDNKMDPGRFAPFVADNYIFYSKLLAKVLLRFQRLDIGSPKNAFMLFRIFKVFSQENLFACIKSSAMSQGHLFQQDTNTKGKSENIFSQEFKDFATQLLLSAFKCLEAEKKRSSAALAAASAQQLSSNGNGFTTFLSSMANFINGGTAADAGDAEKNEREKVVQHLTLVTEKMSAMFELDHVLKDFKTSLQPNDLRRDSQDSVDQTDFLPSNFGLSPSQRRGLLYKKLKADGRYRGNPDLLPIRSDEFPVVVRLLHVVSLWINVRFATKIEEAYYRNDIFGSTFREIAAPPATYLGNVDQIDSSFNASFHGFQKQPVKLPPRIVLRPLGSYFFAAYFSLYLFVSMMFFGYSLVGATLLLSFMVILGLVLKSLVYPKECESMSSMHLSESFASPTTGKY